MATVHCVEWLMPSDKPGELDLLGMFGLRWDITESWMLRTEYHRIHGTAWLPQADNPDRGLTVQDWDLYGLQLSFRF